MFDEDWQKDHPLTDKEIRQAKSESDSFDRRQSRSNSTYR